MLLGKIIVRYLFSRWDGVGALVVWFSLIGIMIGVATLIVVMSVMNGFRSDLVGRIIGLDGHVRVSATQGITPQIIKQGFGDDTPLLAVTPSLTGQAIIRTDNGRYRGIYINGIDNSGISARTLLKQSLDSRARTTTGDFSSTTSTQTPPLSSQALSRFNNNEGVLIGDVLQQQMGITIGDTISMITPVFEQTVFGSFPKMLTVPVVGIFSVGMSEFDSSLVVAPLAMMQGFFNVGDNVENYDVFLRDPDASARVAQTMKNFIKQTTPNVEPFITTWQESNQTLTAALIVERNVMFVILSLIILVAAFNILTGQTMMVTSRLRSIAILRSIGMSVRQIMVIFLCCGLAIGGVGTILGTLTGVILSINLERIRLFVQNITGVTLFDERVYFLRALPSDIDWNATIIVMTTALLMSLIFAVVPALRAARTDPAIILRT